MHSVWKIKSSVMHVIAVVLLALPTLSYGFKVFSLIPFPSKSHFAIGRSIIDSLIEAGHEVTVMSPYPQKLPVDNYTDIDVSSFLDNGKFNI